MKNIDVTADSLQSYLAQNGAPMGLATPRDAFMFFCRMNIDFAPGSVVRDVRIAEAPEVASQEAATKIVGLARAAQDESQIPAIEQVAAMVQYPNIPEWGGKWVN